MLIIALWDTLTALLCVCVNVWEIEEDDWCSHRHPTAGRTRGGGEGGGGGGKEVNGQGGKYGNEHT